MTQTFRWTFASHLSSNIQSYAAKRDIGDYIVLRSLLIPHGTHNHTHHVVHIHRWLIVTCPSTFCRRHRRRRRSSSHAHRHNSYCHDDCTIPIMSCIKRDKTRQSTL